jgi:hypothetical protein
MTKAAKPDVANDWQRRVSFDFGKGKGGMKEPEGFKDLTVGSKVTVLVTGKVVSLRTDQDSSAFSLAMEKLELQIKGEGSLHEDFEEAKAGRKL